MPQQVTPQRFESKLVARGPNGAWVFLPIPFSVQDTYGTKAQAAVRGTLNGAAFQASLLPNGDGTHSMAVNKALREVAQVKPGDLVSVVMSLDTSVREVQVPEDFAKALTRSTALTTAFARMSYSCRKEFVDWIIQAKRPETRHSRIEKSVAMIEAGKRPKG